MPWNSELSNEQAGAFVIAHRICDLARLSTYRRLDLQEIESIKRELYVLPEEVAIYSGHGTNTTIGASKAEYTIFASKPHDPALSRDVLWLE